jgi:hypothetical protein
MPPLTRDQIVATELPREPVECPEWNGTVYVRTVPIGERLELETALETHKELPSAAVVLAYALCDDKGNPLFNGAADAPLLAKQDPRPLVRAAKVAERLNAIKAESIDGLEKNS